MWCNNLLKFDKLWDFFFINTPILKLPLCQKSAGSYTNRVTNINKEVSLPLKNFMNKKMWLHWRLMTSHTNPFYSSTSVIKGRKGRKGSCMRGQQTCPLTIIIPILTCEQVSLDVSIQKRHWQRSHSIYD